MNTCTKHVLIPKVNTGPVEGSGRIEELGITVYYIYLEYQSVCPILRIGSVAASPASECVTPSWNHRGGGNTRLRVRGRGEPSRTTEKKAGTQSSGNTEALYKS
jgi:hypothetical protein